MNIRTLLKNGVKVEFSHEIDIVLVKDLSGNDLKKDLEIIYQTEFEFKKSFNKLNLGKYYWEYYSDDTYARYHEPSVQIFSPNGDSV